MHFAIPDTAEWVDPAGAVVTLFNVHVNAAFHCALRYSQLLRLHEQLLKSPVDAADAPLPPFPTKKVFSLTPFELDQRRLLLERWLQDASQLPRVANDVVFRRFLLSAQRETHRLWREAAKAAEAGESAGGRRDGSIDSASSSSRLDVSLPNDHRLHLDDVLEASTTLVLERLVDHLGLPRDLAVFFGLFLVRRGEGAVADEALGDWSFVREMQDFEAPALSLLASTPPSRHRVLLARRCFDPSVDEILMENRIALNLLYVQTLSELDRGWIFATKEQQRNLETLRKKNSKRDLLRFARTLKFYGFRQFRPCVMDYPVGGTKAVVCIGGQQLVFRISNPEGGVKEGVLKIQRMKCWRIVTQILDEFPSTTTTTSDEDDDERRTKEQIDKQKMKEEQQNEKDKDKTSKEKDDSGGLKCELSIEYLVARDTLQWITLTTDQAVFMSMCLQTMIDELVGMKESGSVRPRRRPTPNLAAADDAAFPYPPRDGRAPSKDNEAGDAVAMEMRDRGSSAGRVGGGGGGGGVEKKVMEGTDENEGFHGIGEEDL